MDRFILSSVRNFFTGEENEIIVFVGIEIFDVGQITVVRNHQEIIIMIEIPPHNTAG